MTYETVVVYQLDFDGNVTKFTGSCTCPVEIDCKHAVALLLTALAPVATDRPAAATSAPAKPAAWEVTLAGLVAGPKSALSAISTEAVGLAFELTTPHSALPTGRYSGYAQPSPGRLAIRPVRRGKQGKWIRTGVAWSDFDHGWSNFREDHRRVLAGIVRLHAVDSRWGYGGNDTWIQLLTLNSPGIWELLDEAVEVDLPMFTLDQGQLPVVVSQTPAELTIEVGRREPGLEISPEIRLAGVPVPRERCLFLGEPGHGVVSWTNARNGWPAEIVLARLDRAADPAIRSLFTAGGVVIPPSGEAKFLSEYVPALRERHHLLSVDNTFTLPEEHPAVLALALQPLPGHQVRLSWEWVYRVGDTERRMGMVPTPGESGGRHAAREARILAEVIPLLAAVEHLVYRSPFGHSIATGAVTSGRETIALVATILPLLAAHPDVEIEIGEPLADYRETVESPVIGLSSTPSEGSRDWFDLTVTITVGGEEIPFEQVFLALATDQDVMILPDGGYFSLDRDEFRQLRNLIEEARGLQDRPGGALRISRFQAGLWDELGKLGVVDAQSAAWLERVNGWQLLSDGVRLEAPPGLNAALRPYQLDGYRWLSLLQQHGMGGILADDMGLGKTVQALAMISHALENDPQGPPFLVIAPTSVLSNWQAEAARFTPDLHVRVITETEGRRGIPLDEAIAEVDIVITSYTLFRLEFDAYQELEFAGLILDEAQAVKNHQSKAFQCAKRLPAPVKFAITGTPMENNLMELWSLFSIVAPGLFPHPAKFNEYYRVPIERGADPELLAQLRRRIRPLMLRRTKDQVAVDLPAKQEQVLELELEPGHRKIYQRHLQRERQKILGLLGDLEKNRFAIFRSLMLLRQASIDPYLVDPANAKVASTKLTVLMELLEDVIAEGHRTLVFSQFTGFLARVRNRLDEAGIDYCYLDGATRNRPKVLAAFREGSAPVFLISLKAGGVGLNLTEADYCILLDPWWNPATEAQAVDRTHRIGQTKKVMVYRLVAKDTIEEKVMALKESKSKLFAGVMSEDGTSGKAITAADIRDLLG